MTALAAPLRPAEGRRFHLDLASGAGRASVGGMAWERPGIGVLFLLARPASLRVQEIMLRNAWRWRAGALFHVAVGPDTAIAAAAARAVARRSGHVVCAWGDSGREAARPLLRTLADEVALHVLGWTAKGAPAAPASPQHELAPWRPSPVPVALETACHAG